MKLRDYLNEWLSMYAKDNVSAHTYQFYEYAVNKILIPNLGQNKLSKLRPMTIQKFLTNMLKDHSPVTVKHYYDILNIALNQAIKWQMLNNNPCKFVQPPKIESKPVKVLQPEQVNILLEYTKNSEFKVMYIPLLLALTTGMRRGEILGLKWEDVSLKKGIIVVKNNLQLINGKLILCKPKTDRSERTISLFPFTIPILKKYKKEQEKVKNILNGKDNKVIELKKESNKEEDNELTGFVCTWPDGRPIRPDYVTHTLKKLLKACNLPDIRFHDLRHTHATLLLLKDVNPKIVADRLGHSDVSITLNTYSHVLPNIQKNMVKSINKNIFKS